VRPRLTTSRAVGEPPRDPALEPAEAARQLETAPDREQIFGLILRAARSRADFVALLSVHAGELRGRRALGDDRFDRGGVGTLRLARDAVPAFERAIASGLPHVGPIATGLAPIDDGLRAALGGVVPRVAMVVPIRLGTRTVALVVGHRGDAALTDEDVRPLTPLLIASGPALARVLASRSEAAAGRPSTAAEPRLPTEPPVAQPVEAAPTVIVDEALTDLSAHRRILEVYRQHGSWEDLAEALRGILRTGVETGEPDEDEQLELLLELGAVEADRLGRPERAIEAWRSARTIDATDRRVHEALERAYMAQGRWDDLIELVEQRAALADDLDERASLLVGAAELAQERLGDDDRAVATYERILGWQPTHAVAAQRLEELFRARGQWPQLAGHLVEQASRHDDAAACVAALEAAAEIYEQRLDDPRAAFLVWLEVLRREPERANLIDVLEPLAPAAAAWDELLPECIVLADELEAEHASAAARLWRQIGAWRQDLGAQEDAATALDRALRLEGDDLDTLDRLVALRRAVGPWGDLAGALSQRAALDLDPARRAELYVELGGVHEDRLGEPAEAALFYQKALDADPDRRDALDALRRLYREQGRWDALAAVLERLADDGAGRPADGLALHLELGAVAAEHLGRPDEAVAAFQAALAIDPKSAAALDGLQRVHRQAGRREAYLDAREAALDAGGRDAAAYAELAAEWEALPNGLDRAIAAWQKALALEPARVDAHDGLARALRRGGRWEALAAACKLRLKVVTGAAERAPVLLELASVLESGLDDADSAVRVCQEVLALPVDPAAALDALARLHQRAGRWQEALDALERRLAASAAADARARADLQQRIGHVHARRGDAAAAIASFERAIALDPQQAAAHEGLADVLRGQGDAARAAHHLLRAAQVSAGRFDAIRCLMAAADLYRNRLADLERGRECLERVLALDPDHADAKLGLGEMLASAGQWEALWPHLEQRVVQLRSDPDAAPAERRDAFLEAARCAVEIGRLPRALDLYEQALALDPTDAAALLGRADALGRSRSWDAAMKAYDAFLARPGLDAAGRADVYRRMAQLEKERGRVAQALVYYQKVLEADAGHRGALAELAAIYLDRRKLDDAITTLGALAAAVSPTERPAVLERIGDLQREKMRNPERAAAAYLQAVELDPANHKILQKLLDMQSEAGHWDAAVATIGRFVELERDPVRRGPYFQAAAVIHQFKLADLPAALTSYEAALDAFFAGGGAVLDPATRGRALEAFQSIDEILTALRDWPREEAAYRTMIERVPDGDPIKVALWHGLGEIYRTRLKEHERAIRAFETAHALDPAKAPARIQILAELYALVGRDASSVTGSLSERAGKLLEADPSNPEALRVLGRACLDEGRLDEAWCVCRALVFLKEASRAEEELYRRYQAHERRKARGILDDDAWKLLRSSDEDRVISSIFAMTWEAPVSLRAGPPRSFDLKDSEKLRVEGGTGTMAKIFQNSARVLNAPLPFVYVQPERSGRLLLANCVEGRRLSPALIVGRDLMTGFRDTELAFAVATTMTLLRPAYYLRLAMSSVDELEAALLAAARVGGRTIATRSAPGALADTFAAEIEKRLSPEGAHILRQLVERLPERPDLLRWKGAVDTAARRAGLLVCGELSAAASMLSSETAAPGGVRPADKVRELVRYAVSRNYFAARRHLGVNVA